MFACGCAEEQTARARWAKAVRSLTKSAVKHDRGANEVAGAVAACWGTDDGNGDISTAAEDELLGWTPTEMTHNDDEWHISDITVFGENAH